MDVIFRCVKAVTSYIMQISEQDDMNAVSADEFMQCSATQLQGD